MSGLTMRSLVFFLTLLSCVPVLAGFDEDYDKKEWKELELQLPLGPIEKNALPFYVSATTENRFFVDSLSLSVGSDGVVRYTLLAFSPEGARNVSYEGMRCETRERRIYASGRRDGSWSKSRLNEWVRIQDATNNRQYAALFLEYFCPGGVIASSLGEIRAALLKGGHSGVHSW